MPYQRVTKIEVEFRQGDVCLIQTPADNPKIVLALTYLTMQEAQAITDFMNKANAEGEESAV